MKLPPLILTLKFDDNSFKFFDDLRQKHFPPEEAKNLFAKLSGGWEKRVGTAKGLSLWFYLGGHWKLEDGFLFDE